MTYNLCYRESLWDLSVHLYLYTTLGCHLCELAEAVLLPMLDAQQLTVELVEIADDDQLIERYGTRIPVLQRVDDPTKELGWPFDQHSCLQWLQQESV